MCAEYMLHVHTAHIRLYDTPSKHHQVGARRPLLHERRAVARWGRGYAARRAGTTIFGTRWSVKQGLQPTLSRLASLQVPSDAGYFRGFETPFSTVKMVMTAKHITPLSVTCVYFIFQRCFSKFQQGGSTIPV